MTEGGRIDQNELAHGQIVGARGPPEHRFYLVFWTDGRRRWLLHKCFTPSTQHMIDQFFLIHFHLDRSGSLRDPTEARCAQCNMLLACAADLTQHVRTAHTCAARRSTRSHHLADVEVKRRFRFQKSLPKVQVLGGVNLRNVFKKKWVYMTYTTDNDQEYHVREHLMWSGIGIEFDKQRVTGHASQQEVSSPALQDLGVQRRHID